MTILDNRKFLLMKEKIYLLFGDFLHNPQKIFLLALGTGIILSLVSVFFIYDMYRDVAGVYILLPLKEMLN